MRGLNPGELALLTRLSFGPGDYGWEIDEADDVFAESLVDRGLISRWDSATHPGDWAVGITPLGRLILALYRPA